MQLNPASSLVLLMFLASCTPEGGSPTSKPMGIIGKNKINHENPQVNLLKQGVLSAGEDQCNATAISPRQVITALHCLHQDPMAFVGFTYKPFKGETYEIVDLYYLDDRKDAVIYIVDYPMDHYYPLGRLDLDKPITINGHDMNTKDLFEVKCQALDLYPSKAVFSHDCDTRDGFSGSAIIQDNKLVGIHHGADLEGKFNYGVDLELLYEDNADIAQLQDEAIREWGHVRSPHIRSPHVRAPHVRTPKWLVDLVKKLDSNVKSLKVDRDRLKVSVAGLEKLVKDLGRTATGKNESVKNQLRVITDLGKDIDKGRLNLQHKTAEATGLQSAADALNTNISNLGASIGNATSQIEEVGQFTTQTIGRNLSTKNLISATDQLIKKNGQLLSQVGKELENVTTQSADLIQKNTVTVRKISEKSANLAGQIGEGLGDSITKLSKDISIDNAKNAFNKARDYSQDHLFDHINNAANKGVDWVKERLADSGPKGPHLEKNNARMSKFKHINVGLNQILVSQNNVFVEQALNYAVSKVSGSYVNVTVQDVKSHKSSVQACVGFICLEDPQEAYAQMVEKVGTVCEKDLAESARAGETGVHWQQVSVDEYCRLTTQHYDNSFPTYKRSVNAVLCRGRWRTATYLGGETEATTYRCVDTRPLLKSIRDQIFAENEGAKEELAPQLDPVLKELTELIQSSSERIVKDLEEGVIASEADYKALVSQVGQGKFKIIELYPHYVGQQLDLEAVMNEWIDTYQQAVEKDKTISTRIPCQNSFKYCRVASAMLNRLSHLSTLIEDLYPKSEDLTLALREEILKGHASLRVEIDGSSSAAGALKSGNIRQLKVLKALGEYNDDIDVKSLYLSSKISDSIRNNLKTWNELPLSDAKLLGLYSFSKLAKDNDSVLIGANHLTVLINEPESDEDMEFLFDINQRILREIKVARNYTIGE